MLSDKLSAVAEELKCLAALICGLVTYAHLCMLSLLPLLLATAAAVADATAGYGC
jgi:sorbitol-specific phosphotransferase system component IIBC